MDHHMQHGPLGISPQAVHLGTNDHDKLGFFPGARLSMNPVYMVSTGHWDAALLF